MNPPSQRKSSQMSRKLNPWKRQRVGLVESVQVYFYLPRRNTKAEPPRRQDAFDRHVCTQSRVIDRLLKIVGAPEFGKSMGETNIHVQEPAKVCFPGSVNEVKKYESKKLCSPACSRQENAIFSPHIHRTWEAYFCRSLYFSIHAWKDG